MEDRSKKEKEPAQLEHKVRSGTTPTTSDEDTMKQQTQTSNKRLKKQNVRGKREPRETD
jgi:hypothetical protein